jgi:hypothetical protein
VSRLEVRAVENGCVLLRDQSCSLHTTTTIVNVTGRSSFIVLLASARIPQQAGEGKNRLCLWKW